MSCLVQHLRRLPYDLLLIFILIKFLQATLDDRQCMQYAHDIHYYNPTQVYRSPNPLGVWTSQRCEIVPGPQYILRRIKIDGEGRWQAVIHHYDDNICSKPKFTISISGDYTVNSTLLKPSISLFGCNFQFEKITLKIHDQSQGADILNLIDKKCPGKAQDETDKTWYLSSDAWRRRRCREYFGLHKTSYSIMSQTSFEKHGISFDLLYFGELPPKSVKNHHKPQGFQVPLARASHPHCRVCKLLTSSNGVPPLLTSGKVTSDFIGSWASESCEPYGDGQRNNVGSRNVFRTRYLKLFNSLDEFTGRFVSIINYYSDEKCQTKTISLQGGGSYHNFTSNDHRNGLLKMNLDVKWMTLTPYDDFVLADLKSSSTGECGDTLLWKRGEMQNITATSGCSRLGLTVPSTIPLIVQVEERHGRPTHLLMGEDITGALQGRRPDFISNSLKSCERILSGVTIKKDKTPEPTAAARSTPKEEVPIFLVTPEQEKKEYVEKSDTTDNHSAHLNFSGVSMLILTFLTILTFLF